MNVSNAKLDVLLHPKSVAVLGASQDTTKLVGKPIAFLLQHKYAGKIYPINPKYKEVAGLTCYPSLALVPGEITPSSSACPRKAFWTR